MTPKEAKVWYYILENRQATTEEIADATGTTEAFVEEQLSRISSPNWREEVWPTDEGRKDDQGKPRMDLVPPEVISAVAHVLTFGAEKYGQRNWEQGMAWGRPYAALMRHMLSWWEGENTDPETGMSHLWHAACCIAFLTAFEQRGVGTDDRPKTKDNDNAGMAQEKGSHSKVA
jgi:hypothetical protein